MVSENKTAAPNYTMLVNLKNELEEIEKADPWAHKFVEDLLVRREEGTLGRLSDKQFMKLLEIHERFCK